MMENREHPPTFSKLRSQLFNHEQRLKRSLQHASHKGNTTLLSTHGHISHSTGNTNGPHNSRFQSQKNRFNSSRPQQGSNRFSQQPQTQNRGRGQNFKGKPYLGKCQICHQQGHSAAKCPFRFK